MTTTTIASTEVPNDLVNYLHTLITPTHVGGESLIALDLEAVDWASIPDARYHGMIARGEPTQEQVDHMWRVVKPGAHVLLIAPDSRPTGYVGACTLEDKGFEIRDAILWVREAGKLHYVPKCGGKERNAGCEALAEKRKGAPKFILPESLDEDIVQEITEALLELGVSSDLIDSIQETGLDETQVPKEYRRYFKKQKAGAGYGNSHPCLHPESLVLTDVGYRQIQTMNKGDKVYSADGKFNAVTDVSSHRYTSPDLFEIRADGCNMTTQVTDNHPYLIFRPVHNKKRSIIDASIGWIQGESLQKGDYTLTAISDEPSVGVAHLSARQQDPEFWFMFGLYIAEGVLQVAGHGSNRYPSFTLGEHEPELVERVIRYFTPHSTSVGKYSKQPEGAAWQIIPFDTYAAAEFFRLGNKGAAEKVLHPSIWDLPREFRDNLLKGYLIGDGGHTRDYQAGKTVSQNLAAQLRILGESLGLRSADYFNKAAAGKIGNRVFKKTRDFRQFYFYDAEGRTRSKTVGGLPCQYKGNRLSSVIWDGRRYMLRRINSVSRIPYVGDVWNLSVQNSPTFHVTTGLCHNTVKPKDVLSRLFSDIPVGSTILDPFAGSGSMALACIDSGYSYIGIEREMEYLEIADTRIRHYNLNTNGGGWAGRTIVSDFKVEPPAEGTPEQEVSLDDLLGI